MSTDRGTDIPRPNLILSAKREERGFSRKKAARELHRIWSANFPGPPDVGSLEKALYRHETGRAQVRDDVYRKLYCLAYDASPHELFGETEYDAMPGESRFSARSHKFITAYVEPERIPELVAAISAAIDETKVMGCYRVSYRAPSAGKCTVYAWPFGAVIFHLVEDLDMRSIAELAVWRIKTYQENMSWATNELGRLLPESSAVASYVLSAYWVHRPSWSADVLDTALRVMCIPKTLLNRDVSGDETLHHATLVERSLLLQGFSHPSLRPFGVKGIATGYASWSGVVYHPQAENRCLAEVELVELELYAQALWSYCTHVNSEVEEGRDPQVPSEYGWRFLRGMRSLLVNPRPQESEQHKSMRSAVLETSGLDVLLTHAIETLRETEGNN